MTHAERINELENSVTILMNELRRRTTIWPGGAKKELEALLGAIHTAQVALKRAQQEVQP